MRFRGTSANAERNGKMIFIICRVNVCGNEMMSSNIFPCVPVSCFCVLCSNILVKKRYIEAISGIDIALWDLLGKRLGTPVCELLGGAFRKRVKVYATGQY